MGVEDCTLCSTHNIILDHYLCTTSALPALLYSSQLNTIVGCDNGSFNMLSIVIVLIVYTWDVMLWDRMRITTILEKTGELPVEDQFWQRKLQWFGHVWRMPAHHPQRQRLWCRPSGRKRLPSGAPVCWCDLLNNNLRGMTNCTDAVQDCAESWATIC